LHHFMEGMADAVMAGATREQAIDSGMRLASSRMSAKYNLTQEQCLHLYTEALSNSGFSKT
jgi:hypothetical protein